MADRSVNIRLSIKDGELVKRALQGLGEEGQAALKRIEAGGEPASRALKAVNVAAEEGKAAIQSWAEEAGAAGRVISAFGPAGIAAAAGFGAILLGADKLIEATRHAADELDKLQDTADRLGVGTEFLQGVRFAAEQMGASSEKTDNALDVLNRKLGEVADGGGKKAQEALDRLGVSVLNANGTVKTAQQALPELADGFHKMGSAAEQAATAAELFGKGNVEFARILAQGSEALQGQIDKAREMGAVLDAELVKKGADAKDQLAALSDVVSAQMRGALIEAIPAVTAMATAIADLAKWVGHLVDSWRALGDQQTATLTSTLSGLQAQRQSLIEQQKALVGSGGETFFDPTGAGFGASLADILKQRQQNLAEIEQIEALLRSRRDASTGPTGGVPLGGDSGDGAVGKVKALRDAYADVTKQLQFQIEQTTRSAREQFIYNELEQAGVSADSDRGRALAELAGNLYDAEQAEKARTKAVEDAAKKVKEEQKAEAERIKEIHDAAKSSFQDLFSTLNSNLIAGQNFWEAFANAGIDALDKLESKLLDLVTSRLFDYLLGSLPFAPGTPSGGPLVLPGAPPVGTQSAVSPGVGVGVGAGLSVNVHNTVSNDTSATAQPSTSGPGLDIIIARKARAAITDRDGQKAMGQVYGSRTPVLRRR